MICSSLYLLVLMSIIPHSNEPLGKMTGTVYGEQVNKIYNRLRLFLFANNKILTNLN